MFQRDFGHMHKKHEVGHDQRMSFGSMTMSICQ